MEYMESKMQELYDAQNELIKELDALRNERDALAAQVESFKKAIKAIENDLIECSYDDESGYFVGIDSISDACDLANYTAPQQCLRDVKAEAVLKFAKSLRESLKTVPVPESGYETNIRMRDSFINILDMCIDEYADTVRKGGE